MNSWFSSPQLFFPLFVFQFIVYASYFCFIALVFFVWGLYISLRCRRHKDPPKQAVATHTDTHSGAEHKF